MGTRYEVAVIGAGPAGAATAYYLARRGLPVLLLDKADFPRDKTCGDGLSPRAVAVLDDMGLLPELRRRGGPISGVDIVAPHGAVVRSGLPARAAASAGLVVPRLILDDLVRRRALAAGAAFESPVRVTAIEPAADGVTLRGERGGRPVGYRARAAVVATGASHGLLGRLGLPGAAPPVLTAARAYYEGLAGLPERLVFRFDGVPLPGYGWVFPLSPTTANVGAGILGRHLLTRRLPATGRGAFDRFVAGPALRELLAGARRVEPVRGYPLRTTFDRAPTHGERLLLVGEAAGLVNPLTGEGIDYALESGRLAADLLADHLASGDLSRAALAGYDRRLRARYQRLFVFCRRVAALGLNAPALDALVTLAPRRPDLRELLIGVVLGAREIPPDVSAWRVARALVGHGAR